MIAFAVLLVLVTLVLPMRGLIRSRRRWHPTSFVPSVIEYAVLLALLVYAAQQTHVGRTSFGLTLPPRVQDVCWSLLFSAIMIGVDHYAFVQAARKRRQKRLQGLQVDEVLSIRFSVTPWINSTCVIIYCSLSAIWEETIFRGGAFYLTRLAGLPIIVAVGLGSLLFSLNHASGGRQQMLYSFVLGCLFAVAFHMSDSLWAVVVAHAIGNAYVLLHSRPNLKGIQDATLFH